MNDSCEAKKEWLEQYQYLSKECERLLQELTELRGSLLPSRRLHEPAGASTRTSPTESVVEEIEKLESRLKSQLCAKLRTRWQIEVAISSLSESRLALLLRLRYISGCKWFRVAEEMHYSQMQVMRLHREALERLELPYQEAI